MTTHDAILIGGGLAGLATALELATAGLKPLLLEGATDLGGRARTDLTDGYAFDRGAHALFAKGDTASFLTEHRLNVPGPIASTAGSAVHLDGAWLAMPDNPWSIATASWLDRGAFVRWFTRTLWGADPGSGSALDWLHAQLPVGTARRLATAITRVSTYGGGLHELDASTAAHHVRVGFGGVRYLEGGWQSMVDAIAAAAKAKGAEMHTQSAVRGIHPEAGRVTVTTDTDTYEAPCAVVCCPPSRASKLLDTPIECAAPIEVAALQLALRPEVLGGAVRRLAMDLDRPVFISDFSHVVSLGPDDAHVVHAIRYLEPGDEGDALSDIEATLDGLWPRWRDGIVARRFMPRMTTSGARPTPGAAPIPQPAPNVWLAGDSYAPGRLLADAAISRARTVSNEVVQYTQGLRGAPCPTISSATTTTNGPGSMPSISSGGTAC